MIEYIVRKLTGGRGIFALAQSRWLYPVFAVYLIAAWVLLILGLGPKDKDFTVVTTPWD
jgi:hypothetical protein